MLPGDTPGRVPPGRGAPGRGACGRGIGRSTGCAEENGLLPTRGVRAAGLGAGPGRGLPVGPGGATGLGAGALAAGAAGAAAAAGRWGSGIGAAGAAGGATGAAGGAAGAAGGAAAAVAAAFAVVAFAGAPAADFLTTAPLPACAVLPPPNASRSRRATGASTVDDADLTNSPCSLSRARTSLLVTPSSFANSCTRALPATTSPSLEATAVGGRRRAFSYDTWSSGLHGVLMFFAACSVAGASSVVKCSTAADVSGVPVMRNARPRARRRIAARRHCGLGCSQAPRPGRLPAVSTVTT